MSTKYSNSSWLRVRVETPGGRIVSIIDNSSVDPGDCDYYVLKKDIPTIYKLLGEWHPGIHKVRGQSDVDRLVSIGLMHRPVDILA